ncbi:MAG: RNA polymerase sigma factor, partial [Clostridia bacterium]|nr:RNA polymerase sigma factor [Clostridia bacterium]
MTSAEFGVRIVEMQETLYRVCYSILPRACDREDAVQECIRIAWQKQGSLRDERYLQTWVIRILI